MAQNLIPCDRDQQLPLPPSLREWLPEDHLAWFVLDAVAEMALERSTAPIGMMAGAGPPSSRR